MYVFPIAHAVIASLTSFISALNPTQAHICMCESIPNFQRGPYPKNLYHSSNSTAFLSVYIPTHRRLEHYTEPTQSLQKRHLQLHENTASMRVYTCYFVCTRRTLFKFNVKHINIYMIYIVKGFSSPKLLWAPKSTTNSRQKLRIIYM